MKYIFSLVSIMFFVFMSVSFGATSQTNSIINVGGGPTVSPASGNFPLNSIDTSGLVMICGGTESSGAGQFFGLYSQTSPTTTAQYNVPNGVKFYAVNMWAYINGNAASFQLGYGTGAIASEGTGTPPSGVIYYGASANNGSSTGFVQPTSGTTVYQTYALAGLSFPAASYPFFRTVISTTLYKVCIQGIVK
jgi:hypothetical protein